jgi:hypothetical protein
MWAIGMMVRDDGRRRPHAEARRSQSGREATPPREPLHGIADAGAVNGSRADAADDAREIEHTERVRVGIEDPGEAGERAAAYDHQAWTDLIDDVPLDGHQPGLKQNEEEERGLDGRLGPTVLGADRPDEQRPAVLQVGDHHHADDADDQLRPGIGKNRVFLRIRTVSHRDSPL